MAMMECPRCRFMQPEDKFCANCGIDVEAYSAPDPIQQKLLPNTTVAAVAAIGIVLGVLIFFWRQPSAEKDLENRLTRDTEFSAQREIELEEREKEFQQRRKARNDAQRAAKLKAEAERNRPQQSQPQPAASVAETEPTTPTSQTPTQLNVRFYEVSRTQLESAYTIGQMLGESSNAGYFKISKDKLSEVTKGAKSLPGAKRQKIENGKPISLISNFSPPDGAISWEFGIEILPTMGEGEIEFSLSGGLYSTGFESLPASQDLDPEIFTVSNNEALVLVGFIPHAPIEEPDTAGINRTPLTIITSADFQDFKTDFVMVMEPTP